MTPRVFLTSFFLSRGLPEEVARYSCAVYQPQGFDYPKVDWTDIRDDQGNWIRPRNFLSEPNPPAAYRQALMNLYDRRLAQAKYWALDVAAEGRDVALCCWCPYDRAAKRQLEQFGSYICHTAVLSEFIFTRLGLPVWEDGDRRQMYPLTQIRGIA